MIVQSNFQSKTYQLKITGLVQGVGFRPFIYKLANEFGFNGWVENRNDGVLIRINTNSEMVHRFHHHILEKAPASSKIQNINISELPIESFTSFNIKKSEISSDSVTEISADITVCKECLTDLKRQKHRINYPFINCTNCGPRFTIIKDLPYDRLQTTMHKFTMCPECKSEYTNILDRRFHAQPIACNSCGPHYSMHFEDKIVDNLEEILITIKQIIKQEGVIAIKGLGGFHLLCDAMNDKAVKKLRTIKHRDTKPFAIMFRDLESIREYANINIEEEKLINSWKRPIVLLNKKKNPAQGVYQNLDTIGAMLPYMPIHYLLFEQLETKAIVLTSANLSGEPILISNEKAIDKLKNKLDAIITYNREIHNRSDDSVSMIVNNRLRTIRRSRGYAPASINTHLKTEGIFASGAELVSSFSIGKEQKAILSQYIGDLKNLETYRFYTESYNRFSKMFRFTPDLIVCDLHPDYLSSQFAENLSKEKKIPLLRIQHHHAHIASVLAENKTEEKVIGISMDGTGLGADRNIWGAEFLIADLEAYQRIYHFENIPLPGAEEAVLNPWRTAISYLYKVYKGDLFKIDIPLLKQFDKNQYINIIQLIEKKINTPMASSAGRLFDAVAALSGICYKSNYHAQAPMLLEATADKNTTETYPYDIQQSSISFDKTIMAIVNDMEQNVSIGKISAKFHNTLIDTFVNTCKSIHEKTGLRKVVLSGGTFQNRYLLERTEKKLLENGFEILYPNSIPVNDQGIAIGQLAIAAKLRETGKI